MKRATLMCLSTVAFGLSCHPNRDVVHVQNVERAMAIWGKSDQEKSPMMCLEYSSPAERLDSHKATLDIPIAADRKIAASYESAQSLAQIYTVSEIMQFGHAALYRLCEAAANGQLTAEQYEKKFSDTLEKMNELLKLQLQGQLRQTENTAERLALEVTRHREALCERYKASPNSAEITEESKATEAAIKQLVTQYESLPAASRNVFPLPELPPLESFRK